MVIELSWLYANWCVQKLLHQATLLACLGLEAQRLELTSGVIWTALNIDYPGHSFSHIGLFFGS
jgi:hypothetical protein